MHSFQNKVAVITGAGSGFGREFARLAAQHGMQLVLADVQDNALAETVAELKQQGAQVVSQHCDVAKEADVQALANIAIQHFGKVNLLFNNAGVGAGGFVWENSVKDWEWVLGVNLWGVIHGVRIFTPLMLAAAKEDAQYQGHIINTASMAGLLNAPTMGIYNVSKHAVVSLSESLYQDLKLASDQISCSVLCPYFVPTGITHSERNRPSDLSETSTPTASQKVAKLMSEKAVSSGKVTAPMVAKMVFDAIAKEQFYIYSHPHALGNVQTRMEDIVQAHNPSDPFSVKPEVRQKLVESIRAMNV